MFKKLIFFLIFTLITSVISFPALAANPNLEFKIDPDPVTSSTPHVKITVKTIDGSDFFIEPNYSFVAWSGSIFNRSYTCNQTNFTGRGAIANSILTVTPKEVTADWDKRGSCQLQPGEIWHFRLWAGENYDSMDASTILTEDFTITQSSGQIVTMSTKNPEVYAGEQPTIILSNAIPGDKYSFYWDAVGDPRITRKFPDTGDNPANFEVKIPNFPRDKSSAALCLLYGWPTADIIPPFKDCYSKVIFTFKVTLPRPSPGPGTQNARCTILPSNSLPINSAVNLKIAEISSGTTISAYAVDGNGKQSTPVDGTTDSTNTLILPLLNKADPGSYKTVTKTADGQILCPEVNFNVATTTKPPPPPVKKCGDPGVICSKAVVKPCPDPANPNDPGIQTAIGCIRTKPASFVQDILRFIIGIAGGLSFLMMLLGAFQMLTSAGNPDALNAGRERLTSAIIGLLFVIFSILLLQVIGFDILKIPGFGR